MSDRDTGLLVRTTPSYSPESNGMAEAFVKTFKRDYAYVNDVNDAANIIRSLEWVKPMQTARSDALSGS